MSEGASLPKARFRSARSARRLQALLCGASLVVVKIETVSVDVLDGELP